MIEFRRYYRRIVDVVCTMCDVRAQDFGLRTRVGGSGLVQNKQYRPDHLGTRNFDPICSAVSQLTRQTVGEFKCRSGARCPISKVPHYELISVCVSRDVSNISFSDNV